MAIFKELQHLGAIFMKNAIGLGSNITWRGIGCILPESVVTPSHKNIKGVWIIVRSIWG